MMKQAQAKGIQSVETGVELLQIIARAGRAMALGELARELGTTAPRTHHYLTSLVRAGLVEQDAGTSHYKLGTELRRLGLAALAQLDWMQCAEAALQRAVATTGATGLLTVMGATGVTIVRWFAGVQPIYTTLALGSVLPLTTSASGRVFLAWLSAAELQTSLKALSASERKAVPSWQQSTRELGYARAHGELIPGLDAIAVPVLNAQGCLQCCIGLVAAQHAKPLLTPHALKSLLFEAREASRTLGS
jgi:DNA-binding IclR family transcriptional regulator